MADRIKHEELIVITKTYDLILWSCNHTSKFPRNHCLVLGEQRLRQLNRASPGFRGIGSVAATSSDTSAGWESECQTPYHIGLLQSSIALAVSGVSTREVFR